MAHQGQITFDAAHPRALDEFWCEVLGYVEQPPPPAFETWEEALDAFGIDRSDPDRAFAILHYPENWPDGGRATAACSRRNSSSRGSSPTATSTSRRPG